MSASETLDEKRERRRQRRRTKAVDIASPDQDAVLDAEEEAEEALDEAFDDGRGVTAKKGRATPGRRNQLDAPEERRSNFLTRPIYAVVDYFTGVRSELAKVTWPTREEARRLTIIVIVTTIVSAIVLGIVSLAFGELFRLGLQTPALIIATFVIITLGALYWLRRGSTQNTRF